MFNQFGDLERCALRAGNVHRADEWEGVLEPVVARYRVKVSRIYFRADAGFANPEVYEYLEGQRTKYAIRSPANRVLQERIGCLLSSQTPGRATAERGETIFRKLHLSGGELDEGAPGHREGRVASGRALSARRLHRRQHGAATGECRCFYNKRGTCEQWIKEGKGAIGRTRLSCRTFIANAVRLQLHALAYNLGDFLRTLATPEPIKDWSLTSLKEKLIKIGAKAVSHDRNVALQMAEVAVPRNLFADILRLIAELRPPSLLSTA